MMPVREERIPWGTPAFRQEGLRKLFHSLSAAYAVLYALAGRERTLWVLGGGVGSVPAGGRVGGFERGRSRDDHRGVLPGS